MNGMRKWLGTLISALALAAISLPTIAAPAKLFGLDMSPSTATTAAVTLTAKYSNLTPNGNSVINTVILTPPIGVTVTGTSFPNGGNKVTCPATTVACSVRMDRAHMPAKVRRVTEVTAASVAPEGLLNFLICTHLPIGEQQVMNSS